MSLTDVVRELIERVDWHGDDGAKAAAHAALNGNDGDQDDAEQSTAETPEA